jgi:hypothetical protein
LPTCPTQLSSGKISAGSKYTETSQVFKTCEVSVVSRKFKAVIQPIPLAPLPGGKGRIKKFGVVLGGRTAQNYPYKFFFPSPTCGGGG